MDGSPGLNAPLLDMLQMRIDKDPARFSEVCLVLDSMALRRQVQYDSQARRMVGFVDLGKWHR